MCVILLNTVFLLLLELAAHWKSNAVSVLGEAVHMLSDLLTVLLSLGSAWAAKRYRGPARCTFGLERLEVLASAISLLSLWVPSVYLLFLAVKRVFHPAHVDRHVLLLASCISLCINLVNFAVARRASEKTGSMSLSSLSLHAFADLMQSLGMFLSASVLFLNPNYVWVDLLSATVCTVVSVYASLGLAGEVCCMLLDASPVSVSDVKESLMGVPAVESVESLHIWCLSRRHAVLMAKVCVFPGESRKACVSCCTDVLSRDYNFTTTNIEIVN